MARVCSERDKRSLFRSWNRLCLHAAPSKATGVTGDVDEATSRVATTGRMERGNAAAVQRDDGAAGKVGEASVGAAKLLERAHEAERALDDQKRRQAGRLVRRTLRVCKMVFPRALRLCGLTLVVRQRGNSCILLEVLALNNGDRIFQGGKIKTWFG